MALCSIGIGSFFAGSTQSAFEWLDLIYLLSYIKLYITLTKYVPQVSFSPVVSFLRVGGESETDGVLVGIFELFVEEYERLEYYQHLTRFNRRGTIFVSRSSSSLPLASCTNILVCISAQLFLDSYLANDWSFFSNPGKLSVSLSPSPSSVLPYHSLTSTV